MNVGITCYDSDDSSGCATIDNLVHGAAISKMSKYVKIWEKLDDYCGQLENEPFARTGTASSNALIPAGCASCARPSIRILCAGLLFSAWQKRILSSAGAIGWGGQDCHQDEAGAFTGDISADMLLGFGCGWALIGHSERRGNIILRQTGR